MKIVVVADHAYITGGQSKVAIESAVGLAGRGHNVTFFAAVGPVDPRLASAGIEVVCLEQGDIKTSSKASFLVQTLWNRKAEQALGAFMAACDPADTVVHVHAWAKALSPSIGAALKRSNLARVYTMHEFFMACPNGGFYDYQRTQTCHRKPMSLSCVTTNCDAVSYPRKLVRVARQLLVEAGGVKSAFPHIITISQLQDDAIRPYMPVDTIWHRVSNPIEAIDRGPKASPGRDFVFVGRLSPEKGVAHFCEAARRAGVTPVIIGDGPQKAELERLYPEANFLGWKSPSQVGELLRDARALVFPSVWYEGQPLTVYEALAAGTPVIVSDGCAGREAIRDGENGLWFRSADAESLAGALRRLSDPVEASRMTAAAYRDYWASPLSLARHLDAIETVYRAALGDNVSLTQKVSGGAVLVSASDETRIRPAARGAA